MSAIEAAYDLDLLLEFVRLLRLAGVRVGLTETQDAADILINLQDITQARTVLRATLVKSHTDQAIFDRVFDLYFGFYLQPSSRIKPDAESGVGTERGELTYSHALERAAQMIVRHAYTRDPSAAVRTQEAILLLSKMVQQRTHTERSLDEIQQDLEATFLRTVGEPQALEALVRPFSPENLEFSQLDNTEAELVEREIERLLAEMRSRPKRRYRRAKRGQPDIRRTLRKSIQFGGTPVRIARKKRRLIESKVFVLADLSSSVAAFARFFLLMTRAFQATAQQCRSFVFVDTVSEITKDLDRAMTRYPRAGEAVAGLLRALRQEGWGMRHSDYGRALQKFAEQFGRELNRHTMIVILGDARSNQTPPQAKYLQRLAEQAERIVWLNPERRALWDSGDSIIGLYTPSCDRVLECRNLEQLKRIVCDLVQ